MAVLVTGGAGYIGSHAVQRLLRDGARVVVMDNFVRGRRGALSRLGLGTNPNLSLVEGDIADAAAVQRAFAGEPIDTVMHFAALAYVGESVHEPLRYYRANVEGLARILEACEAHNVARLVFSSSCSTYGNPPPGMIPVPEDCPQSPVSPYGRTKLIGEWLIRDAAARWAAQGRPFAAAFLRYFNVCGSDRSCLIGEDHEPETHLIPILLQVAQGRRTHIDLLGEDYPTPDGTCVRDYVHVEDLIEAHVLAMRRLEAGVVRAFNVGIGRGYSVREVIEAARRVTGREIPVRSAPRREGDAAMLYNNPSRIFGELGWKASVTSIEEMIESAWKWATANPRGYGPDR
jgi:UDP-glucose 4-epimerase